MIVRKKFNEFYQFLVDDALETYYWMEKEGILCLNNENDYVESGSYGFTHELPGRGAKETGRIGLKDLNPIWEKYLSTLDNLRKVSVSPWADNQLMGEYSKGGRTIFLKNQVRTFLHLIRNWMRKPMANILKKQCLRQKDARRKLSAGTYIHSMETGRSWARA